jgi:hypothetical protein
MLTNKIILAIIALTVVIALAAYAFYLNNKVKAKAKNKLADDEAERLLAQQNLDKRNNKIIADIRFIAQSLVSKQCEMTEAVLRIHYLADALDVDIMLQDQYSSTHMHFLACKDMAIKEDYQNLPKKLRFQQDQQRLRLEQSNESAVIAEAQLIIQYAFVNLKKLH